MSINKTPTIDMDVFNDMASILNEDFYSLLEDFINYTPAQLTQLNSAVEQADFKKIFAFGHAQIGAAGNLGLSKFFHLCEEICRQAKEENIQECSQLSKEINQNFDECEIILRDKINNF